LFVLWVFPDTCDEDSEFLMFCYRLVINPRTEDGSVMMRCEFRGELFLLLDFLDLFINEFENKANAISNYN